MISFFTKKVKTGNFETLKSVVEHHLRCFPDTRNSDKFLTMLVRKSIMHRDTINLIDIFDLPSQDGIKRIRAKFNEVGLYLPSDEKVVKMRKSHQKEIKAFLGY